MKHLGLEPSKRRKTDGSSLWNQLSGDKNVVAAALVQALLLILAGWQNRHALNPDGIAYIQLASHYANGRFDQAVSGYWGPLISWVMVPWLLMGVPSLVAARIVMGLSAVAFLMGSCGVFRAFHLEGAVFKIGVWTVAAISIFWSVDNITPDLLVGSLICFAFRPMVTMDWLRNHRISLKSGAWWGLAYLAKAVAFPLAFLTSVSIGVCWLTCRLTTRRVVFRCLGLTLLAFGIVVGPWLGVLAWKYHKFTISTSARLNHAMVGPGDVARPYPFGTSFLKPPMGRLTVWEDPSMLDYPDWSPLANLDNARHQIEIVRTNLLKVLAMVMSLQVLVPWLLLVILFKSLRSGWRVHSEATLPLTLKTERENRPFSLRPGGRVEVKASHPSTSLYGAEMERKRWSWAAVPILGLGFLYSLGNLLVTEQRYFYPTLPFLFVVSSAILCPPHRRHFAARQGIMLGILACSFAVSALLWPWLRAGSPRVAGECAYALAEKLSTAGIHGPIAGSGFLAGGRCGLYVAFLLNEPWYGDEATPTAAGYWSSEASLVIVSRHHTIAKELDEDAHFQSLDNVLFTSGEEAARFPLRVYRRLIL